MSDPTSLFSPGATGATPPIAAQGANDPFATMLADIKNADGQPKYKDVQTALAALKASQEFIPTLQAKLAEETATAAALAAEASRAKELERLVESLTKPSTPSSPPPSAPQGAPVDIAAEIQKALLAQRTSEVAKTNTDSVIARLHAEYGTEAEKTFYAKAQENGLSVAEINALAAKSPKAVYSLLGLSSESKRQPNVAPTGSTINTAGFTPAVDSLIGKNKVGTRLGATTQDTIAEVRRSKEMIVQLEAQGLSVNDLTDPKFFFKHFS
jgi:LysM repeat protein